MNFSNRLGVTKLHLFLFGLEPCVMGSTHPSANGFSQDPFEKITPLIYTFENLPPMDQPQSCLTLQPLYYLGSIFGFLPFESDCDTVRLG